MNIDVAFDLTLEHGRCVGVKIPTDDGALDAFAEATLLPEERAFAANLFIVRRRSWIGGRAAMRRALVLAGIEAPPILPDARGAPGLPPGIAGSISHKERVAVALVAREKEMRVGVDVEADEPGTVDISSKVIADDELAGLAPLDPRERAREVLLRFSAKEAIYKALDPFVHRFVNFKEVSVETHPDGRADIRLHLDKSEGPFEVDVRWRRFDALVLTTARVGRLHRS